MHPVSYAFSAVAFVSFFAERLLHEPIGIYGAMLVAVISVLMPELLAYVVVLTRFTPDVTITADPLKPDAKTVAGGLKEAMRLCLSVQRSVRVLISRVPGHGVEISLNSVRQRCFVEVIREADLLVVGQSQSALPRFSPGLEPSCFQLTALGDNLRLIMTPDGERGLQLHFAAPRTSGSLLMAAGGVAFLAALLVLGMPTACIAVLPFVMMRFFLLFRGGPRPAFPVPTVQIGKATLFFTAVFSAVLLFNWMRFGLL